jgi:hypothetical protein
MIGTHLAEDDALPDSQERIQRHEDIVFVLFILAVHVELPDTLDAELFLLKLNLVGVWRKFRGERSDLVGERGGEEDNLDGMIARKHAFSRIRDVFFCEYIIMGSLLLDSQGLITQSVLIQHIICLI